jgi:hypothetical protein
MSSRICGSVSHNDRSFFLLCVSVCDPVRALVYPTVVCRSSFCVVCLCGPVYTLVYATEMDRSSFCVVCVCMWHCLCASVSYSDGRSSCCVMYAPEILFRKENAMAPIHDNLYPEFLQYTNDFPY